MIVEPNQHATSSFAKNLARLFFITGSTIIAFFCADLLVSAFTFLFGGATGAWQIIVSAVAAGLICFLFSQYYFKTSPFAFPLVLAIVVGIAAGSWFIARTFTDLSYDGQSYHQTAIIRLAGGWNPFYESVGADLSTLARWIDHYAKAPWYYAAGLYQLLGNIEQAKISGILLCFASFFLLTSFFLGLGFKKRGVSKSLLLAFLMALNPVALYQSTTYYVDGQLASVFLVVAALLGLQYLNQDEPEAPVFVSFFFALVILFNIKFTGLIYGGVAVSALLLLLWFQNRIRQIKRVLLASFAGVLVGVAFVGYNPYLTNWLYHGNPFYPLAGAHAIDLKPYNVPQNYLDQTSLATLALSAFSKSDDVRGENTFGQLKVPFTIDATELHQFYGSDPKEGGFGPLFSGAIVLAAAILLFSAIEAHYRIRRDRAAALPIEKKPAKERYRNFEIYKMALLICAVLVVSAILNPMSSVARYVPQIWLLPLIAVPLAFKSNTRLLPAVGFAVLAILLVNNVLVAKDFFGTNYGYTRALADEIATLRVQSVKAPLKIYFGELRVPTELKLASAGVRYKEVASLDFCLHKQRILIGNTAYLCK